MSLMVAFQSHARLSDLAFPLAGSRGCYDVASHGQANAVLIAASGHVDANDVLRAASWRLQSHMGSVAV